jgi:hypothetical protein
MFAASHLDVECLELLAPLSWTSKLVRVDFSVVLFDPHAAAPPWRAELAVFVQLVEACESARPWRYSICIFSVTGSNL